MNERRRRRAAEHDDFFVEACVLAWLVGVMLAAFAVLVAVELG